KELRRRKNREGKPFAIMLADIAAVQKYAEITMEEEKLLLSERRPILILRKQPHTSRGGIAPSVAQGLNSLGVMLPYSPFHYLLFEELRKSAPGESSTASIDAIVLTSGNISEEPIVIDNHHAMKKLAGIADAFLVYNRDIHNRSDDSVAFVVNNMPRLVRRSRGWTPEPVQMADGLKLNLEGIIAAGAELKNTFCIGKEKQAILSQHIGDLKNIETFDFYREALDRFTRLFRLTPSLIACDLHPEYFSTRYALKSGLQTTGVQHHHAHIASCMAEQGLEEKVIGVSFDGTGYGEDGNIWGSEFLICDLLEYQRFAHFEYIPMPGGDKAAEEAWRMGVSWLYRVYGRDFLKLELPVLRQVSPDKVELLLSAIDKDINRPLTSGAGRLFDAVSSIAGLTQCSSFEAEAPIRLESIIESAIKSVPETYPEACFRFLPSPDPAVLSAGGAIGLENLIRSITRDVLKKTPPGIVAAKFHNALVNLILFISTKMKNETGISTVVLSGGVFQNRYLLGKTENLLKEKGFKVYSNSRVPANDGGVSLGQAVIAAKRRAALV
ncbi:MAG: carbamoyltransferase HypF, partial [Spirochaetota bacterium]